MVSIQGAVAEDALHAPLDALLQDHVDASGYVDYAALSESTTRLDAYLAVLAATNADGFSREGKLAYWINAYNAFTLKLILEHFPVSSIKDIPGRWERKRWTAGSATYSLNDIEHKILRDQLREPRIHFAIVCASIGCPNLWNRAYTGKNIQKELDDAAKRFLQSPKHFRLDREKSIWGRTKTVLSLSSIFKWFKSDFGGNDPAALVDFILPYVAREDRILLEATREEISIRYLPYDWGLNGR